jgi:hypothetical protein
VEKQKINSGVSLKSELLIYQIPDNLQALWLTFVGLHRGKADIRKLLSRPFNYVT